MIILLGVMAYFGYSSLHTASLNFNDYRRLANVNVYSSDINSNIDEILLYATTYVQDREPELISKANARADKTLELMSSMRERLQLQSSLTLLQTAETMVLEMKRQLTVLQANMEKLGEMYHTQNLPNMAKAGTMISAIGDGARGTRNVESLYYQTVLWRSIGDAREKMTTFFTEIDLNAGQEMQEAFKVCEKAMQDAGRTMTSEAGRRDYAAMHAAFRQAMDTTGPMVELGREVSNSVTTVRTLGNKMLEIAGELTGVSDGLMRQNGSATLASNNAAQSRMLLTTVVGLLLGIAFALYTIISLVRTLGKMAAFANDIAAGEFNSDIRIAEKGEIGTMFAAMRKIPEIFSGVISRCNEVANDISTGLFRNRLETAQFTGGFQELTQGINVIADSYTRTIDNLPVGIVAMDESRKTTFANETGNTMTGGDAMKAFGGAIPFFDECLRSKRVASAETSLVSPSGAAIAVAATALPLTNLKGETASGLAVLTDISEIKEKQKLMLQVANDASTVSDRVAAAAEQLAAQVEEISRGADIQRERVESTASAMTQMNSTVLEVARNAGQAADQSEKTRTSAESGAELVKQVVGAINDVNVIGNKLHDNMQELREKAENIGGVMGVISDIADQTNLLALNAAIEAARAGEAGRGFAVVADEVRKLAEKTMAATHEVGENIDAIQHSARVNIGEVEVAVQNVGKATELANASGQALEEIVMLASSNSHVVSSIATAAEEQSATSEEINSSVDEINRITGETASGMVQSSEAVQELSRMAQELRTIMQTLQ